jgi:Beta-lactamase enzyme family
MRQPVFFVVLFVVLAVAGCANAPVRTANSAYSSAGNVKATKSAKASPSATAKPVTRQASRQQELDDAMGSLISGDDGHAAVAVDDLTTGETAAYNGDDDQFVTASIVKVDILATLLYQNQSLTAEEQELATTMIENSDNDSASDLYDDAGGASAIDAANKAFGLTDTTVGTGGYWGLTTTTVEDQIRLLRQVFTSSFVLSSASRDYIQGLMSQVEDDQQWGVPAAADSGTAFMVKNGWLPNPDLWEINSIGEITHDGQRMLVTVLSEDNSSEYSGISLVEQIAKQAATAMTDSG